MKSARESKRLSPAFCEAVRHLIEMELISSGYIGACSIDPKKLIEWGIPADLVESLTEDFFYDPKNPHSLITRYASDGTPYYVDHVRGVSGLRLLWTLADIVGADTRDGEEIFGRKRCARDIAASIKQALAEYGNTPVNHG